MADDFSKDNDLDITIGYNDVGEKAAIKGAENVGKAIEKVGKKAKNASKELDGTSKALADTGASAKPTVKDMKDVDDSLKAITKSAKEATKAQKELGSSSVSASAAAKKGWATRRKNAAIKAKHTAMATAADMKLDGYKYVDSVTSQMSDEGLGSRLAQIDKNAKLLSKFTSEQDKANASVLASTNIDRKKIESLDSNAKKVAALDSKMKQVQSTIDDTSSLVKKSDLLMANATKNIESYTRVIDAEEDEYAFLKIQVAATVNEYDRMQKQLKLQEETQRRYVVSLRNYRDELKATEEVEKNALKLKDEQQKIALLDQQNQRLAVAKAEFVAMSTAAEKYKNTLQAATRVGAKGYVPMPTNVPYTPTGGELTDKLNTMGSNYSELKRVTDARKESTDTIIAEAQALSQAASVADTYEDRLNLTKAATDKFKEALKENKDAMQTLNVLSANTGSNFKTYSKYVNENDAATLSLKNKVTDLANSYYDSQVGLKTQNTEIAKTISMLGAEEAQLKQVIKANNEANKARMKAQASQTAMTQLQGVPAGIASVSSNLVARQGVNTSAMASAKEFLAAADATNVYEDKLRNLDSAYSVINNAMKENKLAMASAKLTMEPLLAAYAEFKGDLDETDPKAKALKDTIEAMKKAYGDNMRAMREQGIEFESTRDSIVAEKKEWESLEKTARQASDKMQKKLEEDARKVKTSQDKIRSGLQNTANMMRTIGMSLTRYVTAPLTAAGVQAVKFTAQMEMNIKSLEILLGNNAKAAEQLYTQVTEYAAKTPYEIPDLTAATKQLLAFGSASGDIMEELRMLGDLAQNDADKLESVTSAFGKVQARGVAHMRELNRFIMAGVPIIQTLGKVLNKDSESLFKAVEAGQVGFDAIKQSIQLLTSEGERFYKMSEKLSQTVKGRWATLSDELNLALKSFADDSMASILRIINKVISLAEAIQTLAPSQRTVIKNWALMAVSLGPVLLGLTKILLTAKNLFDIGAHLGLAGAKLGAMVGGPILAGVLAIVGVLGALYLKSKNITKEYEEQGKIINDMAVTFTRISASGGASKEVVAAYARELRDTVAPDVKVPVIMDIIMNEPDNARKKLQELQELYNDYAVANKKLEQEKAKLVKFRPSEEEMANLSVLSERLKKEGYIFPKLVIKAATDAVAEVERLGKKIDGVIQESSTATTVMGWFKKKLGVTGADVTDVSTLLNTFKYNTEEAINGTLAQFERFYSIVPNIEGAKSAMAELRTVMSDALESETKTFSEKQFKDILEKSGITEGTAAYTLMKFLLTPGEEGLAAAMDVFDEVFDKLPEFTKESIASFKKATEETFEKENLVEFWFSNKAFTDSPDLIAKRAKALSDMYTSIVESAASSILKDKPNLSLQEALEMVKTSNAELFADWEDSLNTASVADAYSELAGLISSYSTQIAEVDANEIEKFNNKVDALLEQLVDTEYYKKVKDSISGLKQDFATLKFDEVEKSLIDQKNALELTADAYYNLTQKNAGFDAAQRASLLTLKKYNDSLTNLKQLSDSLKSSAYGASFASAATDIKGIGMPKLPSLPTKFGKVSNLPSMEDTTVGGYRKGAIAAMAKELADMDDATRKLTLSSAGYLEFMKVIPKAEWDAAVAVAYLAKASTQLATNQIDIASNGKDANDVQIEFWKGIKESVKNFVTPAQLKVIDELIGSFEKLKELGADAAGSAFIDAMADMREEINAFGRDAADTRAAEVLAKQKELLQAIAEDMSKSYSEVLTAFISGTDDEELRANITNAKNILSDFSTYLSNKALADITKTAKEYQKQVDQLGMSDEEKVLDDFRRQYTDAGLAVDEAAVALLRYRYRMIEANDITKDVAKEVENYAKQTAQLGMNEMTKAIDNIERQGKAAKWTSEQIQEVTDSARKYYALQASIEASKANTKKAEDFESLLQQITMEGLLAGKDEKTIWLMQNAALIGSNTELASSVYDTAKAMTDAANAQKQLNDITADYEKQTAQLGMSEMGRAIDNIERQGRAAKWTSEQIQEVTDSARKYYALQASIEARKATTKKAEDFDSLIAQKTMEGLLAGRDGMTVWLMQNAEAIGTNVDLAISTYKTAQARIKAADAQESLNETMADYEKQVEQLNMTDRDKFESTLRSLYSLAELEVDEGVISKIMGDYDLIEADKALSKLDEMIADYGNRLSMLGATDYEQAIHAMYMIGIAAQWTAEQFKAAADAIKAYFDKVTSNNWSDIGKEIGTVGDVFFRNPRQDMYDKIQKAGDEANIGQSEIDANKALYDKVENAKILKDVLDSIADTGFDALISQLEEVGYAMAEGATWGEAFEGTMQNVMAAIINALPQLLMNAGLQLITAGQWPLGLGLIAASGIAALGKGYVNGRVNGNVDGTTTPSNLNWSAKGDSFDRGRILNVPTVFNTASGLNIGGELGTEAILPLSRDSNGRLGVNVAGSGGGNTIAVPVTVNIVNQSGVETEAEVSETTNADGGKNIEVVIKRIVNNGMANGEYDRTMKSRYGLSNRGVS